MSHDLQVIARQRPRPSDLDAFRSKHPELSLEGRMKTNGFVCADDQAGAHVELDGPARIEAEDVPDAANGAIARSGWLIQLSVKPAVAAEGWPADLAVHLARAADGVVYDPQLDRVTWPSGFQPRDPATGEERVSEIAMDWYTAWPSQDSELPRRMLGLLGSHLPEALPKRYGGHEPLPYRFEGEGRDEEFIDIWLQEASGWTPSLFWSATRPCFGASASMSNIQAVQHPTPGGPMVRISARFDSRPFMRDSALRDGLVVAFRAIADGLRCFYAAATLNRDVLVKRGKTYADFRTEMGPMPRSGSWIGLPAAPVWLAWFGPPYAELVRPSLSGAPTVEEAHAIFLSLGTEPMHADDLASRFPPLPPELIAHRRDQPAAWETDVTYTLVSGPPSEPAEVIPDIGMALR